jgi:hypothetical protein
MIQRLPALALALALLAGCATPGYIGVQDYGSVTGRVMDSRSQKAIPGALVSIGIVTRTTDSSGGFTLVMIPEGTQTLTVTAGGYTTTTLQVSVVKNQQTVVDPPVALTPVGP